MGRRSPVILICCAAGLICVGCAQRRPIATTIPAATAPSTAPLSRPSAIADLTLDEIEPRPVLEPPPQPRDPTSRPSLDTLELYAKGRDALREGRRSEGIALLEKAVALDPESFELRYTLARARRSTLGADAQSIEQMEKAASLEPDHLDVHLDLAREYLTRGDNSEAMRHLRLALQTSGYLANEPRALEADLFLAHALQAQGYDRAALDRYEHLLARMKGQMPPRGADPQTATQVTGRLYQTVGDLHVHRGHADKALAAYEQAAARLDDFESRSGVVRTLLVLGRAADARSRASEAVLRFHASPESVALLRDVHRILGRESGATEQLLALQKEMPGDRGLLFAAGDVLKSEGHTDQARRLLADAARKSPADAVILNRRLQSYESDGDLRGAIALWTDAVSQRPDLACQTQEFWVRLARPEYRAKLTPGDAVAASSDPASRGARAYTRWRIASLWPRRTEADAAMRDAVAARPVFAPALRDRLEEIWDDSSLGTESRATASKALIESARDAGDPALEAELRGRLALKHNDAPGGAAALTEAMRLARPAGPELQLAFSMSLLGFDDSQRFERSLSKVAAEFPAFETAQVTLYDFYRENNAPEQAQRVLRVWRNVEPQGLAVRLLDAREKIRSGQLEAAENSFTELFSSFPDDPSVLGGLRVVATKNGHATEIAQKFEEALKRRADSFNVARQLASLYLAADRIPDATRVLEAAREAAWSEPDVLYTLSHLLSRAGEKAQTVRVLKQVLQLEPTHPSAGNDLGYLWAEEGTNLDDAEALIRSAIRAEPENRSVLDSLGWVLYKRGRFDDAKKALEQAVGDDRREIAATQSIKPNRDPEDASAAHGADPVALDHLGDVMYRLDDREAAGWYWDRSHTRLAELGEAAEERDDLKPLRVQLERKKKQLRSGESVSVSSVVEVQRVQPDGSPIRGETR